MLRKKLSFLLLLVLAITILSMGCTTNSNGPEAHLESGVIDPNYVGDPDPQLVVNMKLTPQEQAGNFEKVPVTTQSPVEDLETATEADETTLEEGSDANAARPKI